MARQKGRKLAGLVGSRLITVPARECHCARCGHVWLKVSRDGTLPAVPKRCAKCKAEYWWLPARVAPGRPPKGEGPSEGEAPV